MTNKILLSIVTLCLLSACSHTSIAGSGQQHTAGRIDPGQILSEHNSVRARIGLRPLSWSSPLANFSQQWANRLNQTNGCHMKHRPHHGANKTEFGENLFWGSPLRWTDGTTEVQKISSREVVREWAEEARYYNYHTNSCQPGQQCGHYTQMVWRNTKQVGCGVSICPDKSQVWVCSYNPPGNWVGEKPY